MDIHLHQKDFRVYKEVKLNKIEEDISLLSHEYINNDDFLDKLYYSKIIEKLKIDYDNIKPKLPKEKYKEELNDFEHTVKVKYYVFEVTIPFIGNVEFLDYKPSTFNYNYTIKNASINKSKNVVIAEIWINRTDKDLYNKNLSIITGTLGANLNNLNKDIDEYNKQYLELLKKSIDNRKKELEKLNDLYKELNIETNDFVKDELFESKEIKLEKVKQEEIPNKKEIKKEYYEYITEKNFNEIIYTINLVGHAFERKPNLYIDKDEESLRDMFLLFLETKFKNATATGETFNKNGKTDICIKDSLDNSNVFIAECKFWNGNNTIHETINQLLGYLTYRDNKSSIIIFVKNKEFTRIVKKSKELVKQHEKFVEFINVGNENSFRCIINNKEDDDSKIQVEFLFFHFQNEKK